LSGNIVADFRAEVELSNEADSGYLQARVVVSSEKVGVAVDGTKRTIYLSSIFDIVRDVSRSREAGATETVTLAFRVDGRRETVAISTDVETLVKFQEVLYRQLLDGTEVVATYRSRGEAEQSEQRTCRLSVTGSQVRLRPRGADDRVVVRRDDVTRFKTSSSAPADDDQDPTVVVYSDTGDRVAKTTVRMPSFRVLNLFGRYLRADLLSTDEIGASASPQETIEVLLVDDDPHDLEMASVFLSEQCDRFSLTAVSSASEGLDRLGRGDGSFDCVVSDYRMPGTDGLEFLNQIRERYPQLPFILYTGQGSKQVVKQAILDDVTDYVEKGVGQEQYEVLARRVQKAVR
jgi:CheY-like chemotaxis protein